MKISELAGRLNISPRAIRYYEEKGPLSPRKDNGDGYRSFTGEDAWRLQTILALREAGIPVADVLKVLEQTERGNAGEVRDYLEMQRSALFAQWMEMRQTLLLLEDMIGLTEEGPDALTPAGMSWRSGLSG
ncbi:MerR family transcriptional regulator [Paenibacillus sp. P25]|nr:MerR family transcriptional regulator [Paenibacillus sp. P25]